jgi:hypothetical protein
MDRLSDLYAAIDRLNPDEFRQLRAYIDQHAMPPRIVEDTQTRATALKAALAEIREGLSEEDLDEMTWAMNYEYIEPLDPADYAWLDDSEVEDK